MDDRLKIFLLGVGAGFCLGVLLYPAWSAVCKSIGGLNDDLWEIFLGEEVVKEFKEKKKEQDKKIRVLN